MEVPTCKRIEDFSNFLTFTVEQTRGQYACQHFEKAGYIVNGLL